MVNKLAVRSIFLYNIYELVYKLLVIFKCNSEKYTEKIYEWLKIACIKSFVLIMALLKMKLEYLKLSDSY